MERLFKILLRALLVLNIICVPTRFVQGAESGLPKIAIQPLGKVKSDLIAETRRALEQVYVVEVVVLPAKELPASAYYRPRARYRAEKLLDWLDTNAEPQYAKVIGLTESDISTTKDEVFFDWSIFGLGELGARPCVISSFRLGRKVNRAKLLERLGKVAGHEIGHTYGLVHCPVVGCLMRDAGGKVATVDSDTGDLCESCRQKVPARSPSHSADGNTGER